MAIPPFGSPSTPDATTVKKGKVQLAGDLGGTALAPLVLKINSVTISGTPSSGQAIVATSPSAASWQAITVDPVFSWFLG